MTANSILQQLEALGQPSIKKVLLKHGIKEPVYGVKIEEMKKLMKPIKDGHAVALELYRSGIYDAMYMAGLLCDPMKMTVKDLQEWVQLANAPVLFETTIASVTSEGKYGWELAAEWIRSANEGTATAGWATYADLVSTKPDEMIDAALIKQLLTHIEQHIHESPNRVRYTMNGLVLAVGVYMPALSEVAKETARRIGKVSVVMGDTACKVPSAIEYIDKAAAKLAIGKKRKSARC